ncbi:MAG TPA: HEPN domain-containing protein [Candidatus Tripitaka californicus]|uniref:HEPN domain-containing protein n=1 Tax=Candidatus Tripitaka californicus TaxID=3367616 RepID=UPI0040279BDA|nr:HEPN domain-containing protein [Planctomycetota bacterium]
MKSGINKPAGLWFAKGAHHMESAVSLYDEEGYTDIIGLHAHQAVEKYLKGYLLLKGAVPGDTHDVVNLLKEASRYDKTFEKYLTPCQGMNCYYLDNLFPASEYSEPTGEEIKGYLDVAWEIINRVKEVPK